MIDMHIYEMKDSRYMAVFCWQYGSKEFTSTHIHAHEADAKNWIKLALKRHLIEFVAKYKNQRAIALGNNLNEDQKCALAFINEWFCCPKAAQYKLDKLLLMIYTGWKHFQSLAPGDDSVFKGVRIALDDVYNLAFKNSRTAPSKQ